jgi:hypothetical protein
MLDAGYWMQSEGCRLLVERCTLGVVPAAVVSESCSCRMSLNRCYALSRTTQA